MLKDRLQAEVDLRFRALLSQDAAAYVLDDVGVNDSNCDVVNLESLWIA